MLLPFLAVQRWMQRSSLSIIIAEQLFLSIAGHRGLPFLHQCGVRAAQSNWLPEAADFETPRRRLPAWLLVSYRPLALKPQGSLKT